MLFRPMHLLLACCALALVAQETKAQSAQERLLASALNVQLRRLPGTRIPDQTINGRRRWKIRLSSMSVSRSGFVVPTISMNIAGSNINVNAQNGALTVTGRYRIYRRLSFRGAFTIRMSNIDINARFRRSGSTTTLTSCRASIGNVSVRFSKTLSAFLLNLFRGRIANSLRPRLEALVCQAIGRAATSLG